MNFIVKSNFNGYVDVAIEEGATRIDLGWHNASSRKEMAMELLQTVYALTYNDIPTDEHHLFVLEHASNGSDLVVLHRDDFDHYQKRDRQLEFAMDMIPNLDDVIEQMEG